VDSDLGEGELTVGTQDPAQGLSDDRPGGWRQVNDLIVRGLSHIDARFDRLEGDVAGLKTGVAGLKTGMAETNARLDRFERATERRFEGVDAQFERVFGLIRRDEVKGR
jgi:hypothetical protein